MAFDFSTLPKARSHAYMGSLGEEPCGWNPTTWPNCINVYRNARREFQENYTKIIQMENSYYTALQQMQSLPESAAKSDMIARTNQRIQEVSEARRQGIEVANQLEAKIQEWNWIPGFDTIFLNGLRGLKGLGVVPLLVPVGTPMLILYAVTGTIAVVSLAYIVGSLADSWRATENVEIAKHNAWGQCMKAYDDAILAGKEPPVCGDAPESQDWTTIALIGGSLILAVMLLARK
jgi:hypothetical protein